MTEEKIGKLLTRASIDWREPRAISGDRSGMRFVCSVENTSQPDNNLGLLPKGLQEMWGEIYRAKLFVDYDYGQWGLRILSHEEAIEETEIEKSYRPDQFLLGDLVIGRFIGDQELLLVRCDPSSTDFGSVMVVLPLDCREDWYMVEKDLNVFINRYIAEQGRKYWDISGTSL